MLAEVFILEACGAMLTDPDPINPAYGEAIHAFPHNLFLLQAYRKNKVNFYLNFNHSQWFIHKLLKY